MPPYFDTSPWYYLANNMKQGAKKLNKDYHNQKVWREHGNPVFSASTLCYLRSGKETTEQRPFNDVTVTYCYYVAHKNIGDFAGSSLYFLWGLPDDLLRQEIHREYTQNN